MRFRAERETLADAVAWASRTLPTRPTSPVLAGLRLEADSGLLTLSSFDHEVSSRVQIPVDVHESGSVVVPGRLLADITRALPSAPVEFTREVNRVALACGRSSFNLPVMPAEDLPPLPTMPKEAGQVPAPSFAGAVAQVAIAAGRDDTLPMLTGMRVEFRAATITLAATDRYRLAVRELAWEGKHNDADVLVPARTIADTAKALATASMVRIALAGANGLIGFESDGYRTTSRLLDFEFPAYRQLLPSEASCVAHVKSAALVDAVKRVSLVADRSAPVHLNFAAGEVHLRAGSGEEATASEVIEGTIEGDPIQIAFNPGFLIDGVTAVAETDTIFRFVESRKPAVLTGEDGMSYRYLLMPIRLSG